MFETSVDTLSLSNVNIAVWKKIAPAFGDQIVLGFILKSIADHNGWIRKAATSLWSDLRVFSTEFFWFGSQF